MKLFLVFLNYVLFFVFFSASAAFADNVEKIKIIGNKRIEESTIKILIPIHENVEYNSDDVDNALKNLLESDYFSDVEIKREGKELLIILKENPTINKVVFEGNKRIKDEELQKEISSNQRSVYTRSKIQNDVNRILDIYSAQGRYSTKVEPKIIELDQNRVDVVFEIDEGVQSKISSITFVGNNVFGDSKLRSIINSEETRWYKFLSSSDRFNSHQIEYDKELLSRFYKSKGYANFQVISTVSDISEAKDKFYVTFIVEEGKKYSFAKSTISTSMKINVQELNNFIKTKSGETYDINKIDKTATAITNYLNNIGYAFVNVDPVEEFDEANNSVSINYQIFEGRKAYIRFINLKGNLKTIDKVIRREIQIQEGDAFNAGKILKSEERLNDLDYFSDVKVTQKDTDELDKLDLEVEVAEKSTAELGFSGGYNSVEGPIGMITLKERNLFGRGQEFDISISKAKKTLDFEVGITERYFMDMPLAVGFDLFKRTSKSDRSVLRSYAVDSRGADVRASYEIVEDFYHELRYDLERRKIYDVNTKASKFTKSQEGTKLISSVGQKFSYDKRDSKLDTHSGYLVYLKQVYAGVGGSVKFLKHEVGGAYYVPVIGEEVILELFANAGNIMGLGGQEVSIGDKFFLGADSLRGFDQSGIGPRAKICDNATNICKPNDYSGDALGGKNFYNLSAELKYPITDKKNAGVFGTFFVDAGDVFSPGLKKHSMEMFNQNGIRASAGLGFGLVTPMGPIKITYAFPFAKKKFDRIERVYITFKTSRF